MTEQKKGAPTLAEVGAPRKTVVSLTGLNSTQTPGVRLGHWCSLLNIRSGKGRDW